MQSVNCVSSKLMIAVLAGAALLLAALTPAAAAIAQGVCAPTTLQYKVSARSASTKSINYVDVVETVIAFHQGGSKASCVIVSFSAEAGASADTNAYVKILLDGADGCVPAEIRFVPSITTANAPAARATNIVCNVVTPGSHAVKMQFRAEGAVGATVNLGWHTMIVHYLK